MTFATHSGVSRAAVPRLTRVQPVARAAASEASSRMPPDSSTLMSIALGGPAGTSFTVVAGAERRVQVDQVQPLGARPLPGQRGLQRGAVQGLRRGGLAVDEPDGLAVADVDGGKEFELAPGSQCSDPVGEELGTGVAGLLGVELRGPQRRRSPRRPRRGLPCVDQVTLGPSIAVLCVSSDHSWTA